MTKLTLLEMVRSMLLTEGRIEDAKRLATTKNWAKSESFNEIFDDLVEISTKINPNHKYLQWLINIYDGQKFNDDYINNLIEILQYFDRNNNKFKKRDIQQYQSFSELEATVLNISQQKRRDIDIVPGTEVIYDDPAFVVLIPETHEASCHYGLGSTWCTANSKSTYYKDYRRVGELYYIISRTKPTKDPTYKMAVRLTFQTNNEFPPKPKIAEIRNAPNELLDEETLKQNSSPEVLKVILDDFNKKWQEWFKENKKKLKQEYLRQSEAERQEQERREAEQRYYEEQRRLERIRRRQQQDERREQGEYEDYEIVHALRQFLIEEGDFEAENPEEIERITEEIEMVNNEINQITNDFGQNPDDETERLGFLRTRLEELEEELDGVLGGDIYELVEERYKHYGELTIFTNNYDDKEWAIGTDDEANRAMEEYAQGLIDDRGVLGREFWADYINGDSVADQFEDDVEVWVRDSPDSYLDDDDKELTGHAQNQYDEKEEEYNEKEEEKTRIEERISEIENLKGSEIDENIQQELEELTSDLEDINSDLDRLTDEMYDIENDDDNKEYSEDAIQRAIDNYLDDIRRDPISFLRDMGIDDFREYADEDAARQDLANEDRGGALSGYDGDEHEIEFNGTYYYIYRIN